MVDEYPKRFCLIFKKEVDYLASCEKYEFKGFGITIGIPVY